MARATKKTPNNIELYAERPIRHPRDLLDFISALDEDEGVRIEGDSKSHSNGGFIFVGSYRGSYCINLCDRIWSGHLRKYIAGGNDEWFFFPTAKKALAYAMQVAKHPMRAWLY